MQPTFVYDINNVITKLYMRRHVSGGVLCNKYCIRSNHEENHSHFIDAGLKERIITFQARSSFVEGTKS